MHKKVLIGDAGMESLIIGATELADAVKVTLGPAGKNVIIKNEFGLPVVTKDGVTVAKSISYKDQDKDAGAQLIKQAALATADAAGDGTTTSTVLADVLIRQVDLLTNRIVNPFSFFRGMEQAQKEIEAELDKMKKDVTVDSDIIKQVATISANNDSQVGELIASAFKKIGQDGVVTVNESKNTTTSVEVVKGMEINRGYTSPYFSTNQQKMTAELGKPLVLLVDDKITSMDQLKTVLQGIHASGRSLLIVAHDFDATITSTLVVNKLQAGLKIAAIKAPSYGIERTKYLNDIAVITGGQVVPSTFTLNDFKTIELDSLGTAESVSVQKDKTIFVNGGGKADEILYHVENIREELSNLTSQYEKGKLEERIAKLNGGIAVISVGGITEAEMKEKKDRVDDAVSAAKAALADGVIIGGGIPLMKLSYDFHNRVEESDDIDFETGMTLTYNAIREPFIQILINAGKTDEGIDFLTSELEKEFKKGNLKGIDVFTNKIVDFEELGILDPLKVTKNALNNALSVFKTILRSGAVIIEDPENKVEEMMPDMGQMGM